MTREYERADHQCHANLVIKTAKLWAAGGLRYHLNNANERRIVESLLHKRLQSLGVVHDKSNDRSPPASPVIVRSAYVAEGKNVIGLAWTNSVVKQMHGDGFKQANTIASELWALDHGRTNWNRNTVLIVDEAAMISTEQLARVAAAAKQAGAKLILAGDDRQLASIERGGMFETLRQSHGAAILKEVQRVRTPESKAAFNQMHEGGKAAFLDALKTFEKSGGIHWTTRQSDTLKHMAERYTADVAAAPEQIKIHVCDPQR
jgi:hypothetical protein